MDVSNPGTGPANRWTSHCFQQALDLGESRGNAHDYAAAFSRQKAGSELSHTFPKIILRLSLKNFRSAKIVCATRNDSGIATDLEQQPIITLEPDPHCG